MDAINGFCEGLIGVGGLCFFGFLAWQALSIGYGLFENVADRIEKWLDRRNEH